MKELPQLLKTGANKCGVSAEADVTDIRDIDADSVAFNRSDGSHISSSCGHYRFLLYPQPGHGRMGSMDNKRPPVVFQPRVPCAVFWRDCRTIRALFNCCCCCCCWWWWWYSCLANRRCQWPVTSCHMHSS